MAFIDIPASETGLPSALEQYYEALNIIAGERDGQPLILNNTITTFDITKSAPFYSEGVFRQFADRKFKASPKDLGSAIQADRFSFDYERVIEIASTQVDGTISEEAHQKIENYTREITRVGRELIEFERRINDNWNIIAQAEGLVAETAKYDMRRINYLETILYADQKAGFTIEIQRYERQINIIRSSAYSPAQQKLIRAVEELVETYKISRPSRSTFEASYPQLTELDFADPRYRIRSIFDVSPSLYPSEDLVRFIERPNGERSIEVNQTTQNNELHTKTWGASGGASYSGFFIRVGGGGGGSGESSYRRDFKQLLSFKMDFAGIGEIYANRGLWFDPSLFGDPELKPIFDKIPGARDLEYVGVSLIVARGLKLELTFNTRLETEQWTKQHFAARGGASFFGFSFGGSGGSTSYDWNLAISEDKKSVRFNDDPKHCRLLAVRVEKIYHPPVVNDPESRPHWASSAQVAFTKGLATGKLSLAKFQEMKLNGFNEIDLSELDSDD